MAGDSTLARPTTAISATRSSTRLTGGRSCTGGIGVFLGFDDQAVRCEREEEVAVTDSLSEHERAVQDERGDRCERELR